MRKMRKMRKIYNFSSFLFECPYFFVQGKVKPLFTKLRMEPSNRPNSSNSLDIKAWQANSRHNSINFSKKLAPRKRWSERCPDRLRLEGSSPAWASLSAPLRDGICQNNEGRLNWAAAFVGWDQPRGRDPARVCPPGAFIALGSPIPPGFQVLTYSGPGRDPARV